MRGERQLKQLNHQQSSLTSAGMETKPVQFSFLTDWLVGTRDRLPGFSQRNHREQFWHGHERPLFDVVHPIVAFPPPLQGAVKNSFGEAGVACNMFERCEFPPLDSCQKKLVWPYKDEYANSSVQFLDRLACRELGSSVRLFLGRPLRAVLAWTGTSTL